MKKLFEVGVALEELQDDLNGEIRTFKNFDGDPQNRSGHSIEELSFERGAARAMREVIEKLEAIIDMTKRGD
tara:strand:+ start:1384 stop:1599 length:216 start_codon:yes stop_codon:yes gene_type:complete